MDSSVHPRIRQCAVLEADAVCDHLHVPADGLSTEQAEKSRAQFGSNAVSSGTADTVGFRLCRAFINPFTVILFLLAVISLVTDVVLASNFSRNATTVIIICCMLLLSGTVRFVQELRAKRISDHLSDLTHTEVTVCRDGQWIGLPASALVVGDLVRLSAGDRVPADLRLIQADDLFVSQSIITGESAVLEKTAQALSALPRDYAAYQNTVFQGCSVIGGSGQGIVLAVGQDTVSGGTMQAPLWRKNGFDRGANSIAWVLIRFMAVLVPIVFVAVGLTKGDWFAAFLFALSVAVGLTPEMLPMVINACLAKGSAAMEGKQTVVKNINAMQGFGSMDVLCVDKTGTLTGDTVLLEYYLDVLGNESERVLELAYLSSRYATGVENHLDRAILRYGTFPGWDARLEGFQAQHPKLDELPFDYNRRCSSVLVGDEACNLLIVKGSVDAVCRRCSQVVHRGALHPFGADGLSSVHAVVDEMLEDGMKVLAVAYRPVTLQALTPDDEHDLILLGYLVFFDAPKASAASAIDKLDALHVRSKVLTGDQKSVAVSICRRLGIDTTAVLTGEALDQLTDNELPVCVERCTVFAELSPKQKMRIVQVLQDNGHTVGFLGDGMNDLPAITAADVGISVDTAAESVRECADVLLLKKDLNVLEAGILEGRKAFANMTKYIKITASSNFGNIFSIVIASVFLPFFPMTSVQLLLLNLLYDMLCLVLPWDKVDGAACARPLEWSGRTLGRFMRFFGPISSFFDILTFGFLFFWLCPQICGGNFSALSPEAQRQFVSLFQTGWFLESMWTQILILHLLRTQKVPLSRPSRPVMLVTLSGIVLFTALVFTPLGALIGLIALPMRYFAFLTAVVVLYLLLVTVAKTWYLRRYHTLL